MSTYTALAWLRGSVQPESAAAASDKHNSNSPLIMVGSLMGLVRGVVDVRR